MAAIDYTVIVYKNGEYMEHPYKFDEEKELCINKCPFDYARDGMITHVEITDADSHKGKMKSIVDEIKWYRNEHDCVYERDGIDDISHLRFNWFTITQVIKWKLHLMKRVRYNHEIGVWKSGDKEVYIYIDNVKQTCVSFYKDTNDTYAVLGGYGHYENPYTHFMNRGYGDEFESKMAVEAYQWLCRDILDNIPNSIFDNWKDISNWTREMRKAFRYEW